MAFRNFSIWRGRLPHWRADGVTYYVTFRHRRPLDEGERQSLLKSMTKADSKQWRLLIACVLPEATELLAEVLEGRDGRPLELSKIVERAKTLAGKLIIKKTGERFAPFYGESYDRIVRDDIEFEDRWQAILDSPVSAELAEDPEHYNSLYVAGT